MSSEFLKKELGVPEINFGETKKRLGELWKALLDVDDEQRKLEIYNKVSDHIRKILVPKYGLDFCQKTLSFHIFVDGSLSDEEKMTMEREDFPGENSLERFANSFQEHSKEKLWGEYQRLREKFKNAHTNFLKNRKIHQEFDNFLFELEARKGLKESNLCIAFHVAAGSTLEPEDMDGRFFDFDGEDSIEERINSQLAKIEKEK